MKVCIEGILAGVMKDMQRHVKEIFLNHSRFAKEMIYFSFLSKENFILICDVSRLFFLS